MAVPDVLKLKLPLVTSPLVYLAAVAVMSTPPPKRSVNTTLTALVNVPSTPAIQALTCPATLRSTKMALAATLPEEAPPSR